MASRIGQMLVNANLISEDQLMKALDHQKKDGGRLGSILVKMGSLTEDRLVAFLSKQYGIPAINLTDYQIDAAVARLIPAEVAQKYQVMPVARVGATLTIAMVDPSNVFAIDDIKFMTGYNVEPVVAAETAVRTAMSKHYEQTDALQTVMDSLQSTDTDMMDFVRDEEDL
ncbi:MAG: type II secretion system protein GspE, partial [Nitrospirae bacterium]|nr:type II secretion system protein GspE [Nitrospirota bacterium]